MGTSIQKIFIQGGTGSGFHGHKGRIGEVGGSSPRGTTTSPSKGYHEFSHNRSGDTMTWGKRLFDESGLTEEDISALRDYKGSSFALNDWLRADGYSNLEGNPNRLKIAKTERLDAIIPQSRLPEPVLAFRGINRNAIGPDTGDYTGVEFMDKAFVSTTLHLKSALGWSWNNQDPIGTVVQIQLKKGSPAMFMDEIYDRGEYELLLPRNMKFRVVKDETVDRFGAPDPWRLLTVEVIE
jgi:hypothetical protein